LIQNTFTVIKNVKTEGEAAAIERKHSTEQNEQGDFFGNFIKKSLKAVH
jgi:hypothetical protein